MSENRLRPDYSIDIRKETRLSGSGNEKPTVSYDIITDDNEQIYGLSLNQLKVLYSLIGVFINEAEKGGAE